MAPEAIAPYCMDPGSDSRPGDRGGGDRDGEGDDHEGMSMRLGRASDIWSLGCILYQMIYGRPPFAALTTIQKLRAIPDDKYVIQYPSESEFNVDWDAVGTIQACLQRDPRKRARIKGENGLLSMPFLSIDAMQHSRIRNEDKYENNHENKDENRSQKVLKDKNNDNCISVSKDKVRNSKLFASITTTLLLPNPIKRLIVSCTKYYIVFSHIHFIIISFSFFFYTILISNRQVVFFNTINLKSPFLYLLTLFFLFLLLLLLFPST